MRKTKKITVSAMMCALGIAFMTVGYFVEALDLTACALVSLIVALVYVEIGSPYTYLVWICTSLLSFLFFSAKPSLWLTYFLVFGIYPILKAYIEKLIRPLWIVLKLVYLNAVLVALFFIFEFVFMTPFFDVEGTWIKAAVWALMNVAFIAYDLFITVLMRLYALKYRKIFSKFFK
jgi:hypothetical protein